MSELPTTMGPSPCGPFDPQPIDPNSQPIHPINRFPNIGFLCHRNWVRDQFILCLHERAKKKGHPNSPQDTPQQPAQQPAQLLPPPPPPPPPGLAPDVIAFNNAIPPCLKSIFTTALNEAQKYIPMWANPDAMVWDWNDFLILLDIIVTQPPEFFRAQRDGITIGEPIGVPLYLILDLISNTCAGHVVFTDPDFNGPLMVLLNAWGAFLTGPGSNATLNAGPNGWFSPDGLAYLEAGLGRRNFQQTFAPDALGPGVPIYNSWDSFFTRQFLPAVPAVRPLPAPLPALPLPAPLPVPLPVPPIPAPIPFIPLPNPLPLGQPLFVVNACESTVLRTVRNAQVNDTFWLKEQNYSIHEILGGDFVTNPDTLAPAWQDQFAGASVYQAFLSPGDYHRWHSPVAGNIVASVVFPGTYYATLPDDGAPRDDPDLEPGDPHGTLIRSQPWLTARATRAVYIIAPDPAYNLAFVAFVAVGMAEVSTCDIFLGPVNPPAPPIPVNAGQQTGTFHFGGSSHILLLQPLPGFEVVFEDPHLMPIRPGQHRWVNSGIARVRPIP